MKKNILQEESPIERMANHAKKLSCDKKEGWIWNAVTKNCEEDPCKKVDIDVPHFGLSKSGVDSIIQKIKDKGCYITEEEIYDQLSTRDHKSSQIFSFVPIRPLTDKEKRQEITDDLQDYFTGEEEVPVEKPEEIEQPKKITGTPGLKDLSTDELIDLRSDRTRLKELYAGVFGPGGDGEKALNEYNSWSEEKKKGGHSNPLDNFFLLRYFLGTKIFPMGPGRAGRVEAHYRRRQKGPGNLIYDLERVMNGWRAPSKMLLDKAFYDDHGFPWPTKIPEGQTKESYRKLQYEKLKWFELMIDPDRSVPTPKPVDVVAVPRPTPEPTPEVPAYDEPAEEAEEDPAPDIEEEIPLMEITKENDFRTSLSLEGCGGPCVPRLKIRWEDADYDDVPDSPGGGYILYGKNDPLNIRSDTRYDLNPFMQKFFGVDIRQYWNDNKEDIIKPIIVRRNNGTVERPKTLENNFSEGDVSVSVPNFWPIHVAFAYEEYVNNMEDEENVGFEYVLFHPDESSLKRYRAMAAKWGIKIEYDARALLEKAKEVVSRRIAYYGTAPALRSTDGRAAGGFGHIVYKAFKGYFQKGMLNPHGGIGRKAAANIINIESDFLTKAAIGQRLDRKVRDPLGNPLWINKAENGGIESISLRPGHGLKIEDSESKCANCAQQVVAKQSQKVFMTVHWAPPIKYIDEVNKEVLNLGHPVLLPKNWRDGEVFTKAERIFAKRLGIKLDLDYKWSFKTGETNLIGVPNYAYADIEGPESRPYYFSDVGGIAEETPSVQMIKIIRKSKGKPTKSTPLKKELAHSGLRTGRHGLVTGQGYVEADKDWLPIREHLTKIANAPRPHHPGASPEVIRQLNEMTVSDAGRLFLQRWEARTSGEKASRVHGPASGADPTIGVGHAIQSRKEASLFRPYDIHGLLWHKFGRKPKGTKKLTEEQVKELYDYDLEMMINRFIQKLTVVPTQNQFDALFSYIYNSGPGNKRRLYKAINDGNITIANSLMGINKRYGHGIFLCPGPDGFAWYDGRNQHARPGSDGLTGWPAKDRTKKTSKKKCRPGVKKVKVWIEGLHIRMKDQQDIFSTPDSDGLPMGSRKRGEIIPHWAGELYGTRLDNMDRIKGKVEPSAEPEPIKQPEYGTKIPFEEAKVLIFGHSQSGSSALGGRQHKVLKSRKIESNRKNKHMHGVNDDRLAEFIKEVKKSDGYTHAILHLNGNDHRPVPDRTGRGDNESYPLPRKELSKKSIIDYVIKTLGIPEDRIWLLVPPHNKDYKGAKPGPGGRYKNREESSIRTIEWFKLNYPSAHVPDLIYAGKKSFWKSETIGVEGKHDTYPNRGKGLHISSNSPESMQLATKIANEMERTIERSEKIEEAFTINNIFDIISETIEKNNELAINKL